MTTHDLEARAASRLDAERTARLNAITHLGAAAEHAATARAELVSAEKEHTDAYAKALRLGWNDADLKELGIDQPGRKPAGRPRAPKKPTLKPSPEGHHGAQD